MSFIRAIDEKYYEENNYAPPLPPRPSLYPNHEESHPETVDNYNTTEPCCNLHTERLQLRKQAIILENQLILAAELRARFHWLDALPFTSTTTLGTSIEIGYQSGVFAPFESMFLLAWEVVSKRQSRIIVREELREFLSMYATVGLDELQEIEAIYPLHSDVSYRSIIVSGAHYSKEKFIEFTVRYIQTHDSNLFITPT